MNTAARPANAEQIEYWNEVAGPKWVRLQLMLDKQLDALGLAAMEAAALSGHENVLDVGCGCGSTTLMLARQLAAGGRAVGVDISRPMLEQARQRAHQEGITNISFQEADAQVHRFPDEEYDLMFSRFGVMFFEDPIRAFENIRTSLRPGGRLSFICWQAPQKNPWMSMPMMIAMKHVTVELPATPDGPGPFAFADGDRLHRILRGAGFSGISVEAYARDLTIGAGLPFEDAVQFILDLGPVGRAIAEAPASVKDALFADVSEALKGFDGPKGLRMPSATWIVTAEN